MLRVTCSSCNKKCDPWKNNIIRVKRHLKAEIRKACIIENIKGKSSISSVLAWETVDELTDYLNEIEIQNKEIEFDCIDIDYDLELSQREYDV